MRMNAAEPKKNKFNILDHMPGFDNKAEKEKKMLADEEKKRSEDEL